MGVGHRLFPSSETREERMVGRATERDRRRARAKFAGILGAALAFPLLVYGQAAGAAPLTQTFTISAAAGVNGTITPSGLVTVNPGDSQTLTITPAADYHVADVVVRSWLPSQIVDVPAVVTSYESGCTK